MHVASPTLLMTKLGVAFYLSALFSEPVAGREFRLASAAFLLHPSKSTQYLSQIVDQARVRTSGW